MVCSCWRTQIIKYECFSAGPDSNSKSGKQKKDHEKPLLKSYNVVILDNPDRENIKISVIPIPNNVDDEKLFHWMVRGIMKEKLGFERHLIFCASIKDCSRLYYMFSMLLGNTCTEFVNMYHSKTQEYIKEKFCTNMESDSGKYHVLICTNAAGMGVNFKNLNNVIHYGVPHNLDTFVQQIGCAGRDRSFSFGEEKEKKNVLEKLIKKL